MLSMSAADEQAGAFTYLKSPKSLIDNIFISSSMKATSLSTDYFVVAKEQSMDKFVKQVSDHRPVVLRVSISDGNARVGRDDSDLNMIVDRIISDQPSEKRQRRTGRGRKKAGGRKAATARKANGSRSRKKKIARRAS
jgi:hypothetical protein